MKKTVSLVLGSGGARGLAHYTVRTGIGYDRKKSLQDQIADGEAKVEGDVGVLKQLASTLVHFTPDFEILPGTKGTDASEMDLNDFEVGEVGITHE